MRKMTEHEEASIRCALRILEECMRYNEITMNSPQDVANYLKMRFAGLEHEEFHIMFLNAQNRVIETDAMFRGTLTQTSVYPREVVKRALELNANAVILAHNHPSGTVDPSRADEFLTKTLKDALALVDVKILDHVVVAGSRHTSFAERGLL